MNLLRRASVIPLAALFGAMSPVVTYSQNGAPEAPLFRQHHAVTYDPGTRRVLMYGGLSRDSVNTSPASLDDLWSWDGVRWSLIARHTGFGLVGHLLFADGAGGLFVTAGEPRALTGRWDGQRWVTVTEDSARARSLAAGAYDTRRKVFVLHGGQTNTRSSTGRVRAGDTWEFDGQRWSRVATDGPGPRTGASMVYDERRQVMVLFGGRDASTFFGDTWLWDGIRWKQVVANGPPPRLAAGMAYDSRKGETVLFGGYEAGGYRGDTWVWNGQTWKPVDVAGPSPRADPFMAYDASRGVAVLFGGTGNLPTGLGDTWEWTGSSWMRR
jgi:hypothetical protein